MYNVNFNPYASNSYTPPPATPAQTSANNIGAAFLQSFSGNKYTSAMALLNSLGSDTNINVNDNMLSQLFGSLSNSFSTNNPFSTIQTLNSFANPNSWGTNSGSQSNGQSFSSMDSNPLMSALSSGVFSSNPQLQSALGSIVNLPLAKQLQAIIGDFTNGAGARFGQFSLDGS